MGWNYGACQLLAVIATCLLAVVIALVAGKTPILSGRFPDTDDYMRLVQVFRWLDGSGWWGQNLPRLNPPTGTIINWARFADLPFAAVTGVLEPWMGRIGAATLAAALVPPVLLLPIFLYVMNWLARPVVGPTLALFCGPFAVMSVHVFMQFVPGRADHHNWHIILSALGLAALVRLALLPDSRAPALVAAVAFALGLWVGGESLPWLGAFNLGLGLIWVLQGRAILASAMTFALSLSVLCAVVLPLAQPPGLRLAVACDNFGIFYASLPAFMLGFWAGLWVVARHGGSWQRRLGLGLVCASIAGAALFLAFPECRSGPYSHTSARLTEVWLQHTTEMLSLSSYAGGIWKALVSIAAPIAATALAIIQSLRVPGPMRSVWLAFAVFLITALSIAILHVQVLPHLAVFSVVPLVWLAGKAADGIGRWGRAVSKPTIVAILYCSAVVIIPAYGDALMTSAAGGGAGASCDIRRVSAMLDDPAGLGAHVRLIAAPIDNGPELLFRTPHNVLAAPFERDETGNIDLFDFFAARNPEDARLIAVSRHIDIVLFCPSAVAMWLPDDPGIFLNRLKGGEVPAWLRPLEAPKDSGVSLYEVRGLSG